MPKLATPLTDIQVRNAKPKDKPYTLADGGGMYLEVAPTGSKIWRMAYSQPNGKNTRMTFGAYPEVMLLDARQKRMIAKKQKAAGTDPAQAKRIDKISKATASANTFEAVAREWHANKLDTWQERTAKRRSSRNAYRPGSVTRAMRSLKKEVAALIHHAKETAPISKY
jgi:hypothetical protein